MSVELNHRSIKYLNGITLNILKHAHRVAEAQVTLVPAFSLSAFLILVFLMFIFTLSHWSYVFAGHSRDTFWRLPIVGNSG